MKMKLVDFNHLTNVGETYWQHLHWCLYSSFVLITIIPIALIHGFFPVFLANVPDKIMVRYLRKFNNRRVKTGQAERRPV